MAREPKLGVGLGDYPTTPLLLERTPKKHNILIGNDRMQIRWAEQFLSMAHDAKIKHQVVETVNDDMVHSEEPKLFVVERSSFIDLAPAVKARTGIWQMELIEPKTAGLNAIVRQGAKLMGIAKPDKDEVQRVANAMDEVFDIRAAIWHAAWLWSGTVPEKSSGRWLQPWENWLGWMPQGVDPRYRLNTLYWDLVRWVFASTGDERGFRRTKGHWNAKRFTELASLTLPKDKVYNTLVELSIWKDRKYDPWVCALKVSKIWESK